MMVIFFFKFLFGWGEGDIFDENRILINFFFIGGIYRKKILAPYIVIETLPFFLLLSQNNLSTAP